MKSFDKFLRQLLKNPSDKTILKIKGVKRKINGMARFTSVNYAGEEYIKITFKDHSHLLVIPSAKELYWTEKSLGKARGITDKMIGKPKVVYKGKEYKLDNKNDYQFSLQLYVGKPHKDIEGECDFSDYVSSDGNEMLSLGFLSYNGKRADVYVKKINLKEVKVVNI
jgi:hypothetical protein